jgi:hypothetical protein
MRVLAVSLALAAAVGLTGCVAPPPTGPSVLALPGANKSLAQFQTDDAGCRTYAQRVIGPTSPAQAAAQSGVGSAAVGTVLGAAAGAAIGAGAGTGLVLGAGAGATNLAYSGAAVQRQYDAAYIQCMVANGDKVQSYPAYAGVVPGPYAYLPYPYAYPYFGYGYPGYFAGPVIAFGFGGGWGWGGWGGWHGGWRGGYRGGRPWWH